MSRRTVRSALAGATALSLMLAPTAAVANDDAPTEPMEVRGSSNSVGQSVQIRTNADGDPNSATVDFRWSVTQIGAQGDPGADITVAVPEEGLLLHNLQEFGMIPQEDGKGQFDISLNDTGFGTARSVSLVPPEDFELPVELTTEFTLDGEPILAQDLVGKDGVVTAKYTVINKTRETLTVPITSVTGEEIEKEVEADVPMVVEAVTLLPDRFSALNTGTGLGGADGRGNTQVKWIALPFSPLSADGTSSFGWAANVTDAVIPSMLVQVLPIYIPEGEAGEKAIDSEAAKAARASVPPPDVSGDVNAIKDGVADVISGLETLTADDGSPDPLTTVEGKVNDFFTEFGTNLETVSTLVDPNNPEGATALVAELQVTVDEASATITQIEESGVIDQIDQAAALLTPENAALLVELSPEISKLADNAATITKLADSAEDIQAIADNAGLIATSIKAGCIDPPGELAPTLPPEVCDQKDTLIAILESEELQTAATILNSPEFQKAADIIASPEFAKAADALETVSPILVQLSESLQLLDELLPGVIATLKPVLTALDSVLAQLTSALTGLSSELNIIGEGIASKNVDLPTLDAVLASITESILSSEGGQQVTSGLDQISGGIAGVKTEIGSYVAELAVALQAAKAEVGAAVEDGKEAAGAVIDKADTLKAEVVGLKTMAGTCPLPYGCDVTEAPEGTKLAGAYEFRMDPADQEAPSTLPRILLGLVLLLIAGFVGARFVTARQQAAVATAGGSTGPDGPDAGGPVDGGYPSGSDEGGSAAGLAAAGAAGAGVTAVALADGEESSADETAALAVDAPEELSEAGDSVEGAVGDVADEAQGEVGDMADQAQGEVGDMADQAQSEVDDAAASVEGAATEATEAAGDVAQDAGNAVEGAAEDAPTIDLPGGDDGGENKPW
jgi:hypothetical protein